MSQLFRQWCIASCLLVFARAAPSPSFEDANQLARSGDHAAAITIYQTILAHDGSSPGLLYNLGNSYLATGDYGRAILAYERARLLTPRDPDLLKNLALARKTAKITDPIRSTHPLAAALDFLSRREWAGLLGGMIFLLAACSLGLALTTRRLRKLRPWYYTAAALAALLIACSAYALRQRRAEGRLAVVTGTRGDLRLSPFDQAEVITHCKPGTLVLLGQQRDGYHYIQLPDTDIHGWLAAPNLEPIIPRQE